MSLERFAGKAFEVRVGLTFFNHESIILKKGLILLLLIILMLYELGLNCNLIDEIRALVVVICLGMLIC